MSDPLARSAQGEPEPAQAVEVEAAAVTPFRCLAAATFVIELSTNLRGGSQCTGKAPIIRAFSLLKVPTIVLSQ